MFYILSGISGYMVSILVKILRIVYLRVRLWIDPQYGYSSFMWLAHPI